MLLLTPTVQWISSTLDPHLAHPVQSKVSFEPEKGKVSISGLKEVRCHQHTHMHVHRKELKDRKKRNLFYAFTSKMNAQCLEAGYSGMYVWSPLCGTHSAGSRDVIDEDD